MGLPLTAPNVLTLLRIGLIPIFVVVFYLPFRGANLVCALIFGLAAVTDWLDGYLARRLGQTSPFGAFLDPVADKMMVAVALVVLVQADQRALLVVPAMVIIGREIAVSALREWMAGIGERTMVAVSVIGKIKTTFQMIALLFLIYREPLGDFPVYEIGVIGLYVAAFLTLWSMVLYARAAWPALTGQRD